MPIFGRSRCAPEYNEDSSTVGTKGVLNWYLGVVERDVRCSSSRRNARLDLRCLDTFTTFYENSKRRVALQEYFEGLYSRSSKPCDLEDHSITLPKNLVVNTRRSVKENEHIFCLVSTVRGPVDFSRSLTLFILTLVYTFPCLQHQIRGSTRGNQPHVTGPRKEV